ncbi:MAG: ABC transporter ATP-binding protein [Anaerolineales bacterium]|jgi:energy-coupling factor transport system ATP-binding protein
MRIEIQNLEFTYPSGVEALRGVSFTVMPGEKLAIVGQNGAGKTTLVKHFNGLLKPTNGWVLVGDWDTREHTVAKLASRVGYVFQNPDEQLFSRTVEQEVAVGPKNLGYAQGLVDNLVAQALALTHLEDQRQTNPYDLSPTWRKMVAMASIIAMDTPVVIFDEPTTGQDATSVAHIGEIVEALHRQDKTVITITHDIDFAADHFERLIAMGQGKVLLDSPMLEGIAQEKILASTYVDPPQITRLGMRLGLPKTVKDSQDFLDTYRRTFFNHTPPISD